MPYTNDVLKLLSALALAAGALPAQSFPKYDVYRAASRVTVDAKLDEPAWKKAPPTGDFHFNWWTEGAKEPTTVKLVWDDTNLYIGYYCVDKHISASVTKRHGPDSKDDCVEAFISPNPEKPRNYYGFEMNVIGTMLNFIRADWYKGPFNSEPEGVQLRTTYYGLPEKKESPEDDHWILEVAIPFSNFVKDAAHTPPRDGDTWRINLNRAGGITDAQYSTWSPITTPKPNFHVPESSGYIRFVNREPK